MKSLQKSYPVVKKFRTKPFPFFEAMGELHDGHTAEGTYNFTSTQQHGPDLTQVGTAKDGNTESRRGEGASAENQHGPEEDEQPEDNGRLDENQGEGESAERPDQGPQRRVATASRNGEEREPKKHRKSSNLEGLVERYLDMRTKLVEDEAAQSAKEREAAQDNDFSIKKCISVLTTMEVTKEEKAKAYRVFKDLDNRQIFLSACDDDPEAALIWLRSEMS